MCTHHILFWLLLICAYVLLVRSPGMVKIPLIVTLAVRPCACSVWQSQKITTRQKTKYFITNDRYVRTYVVPIKSRWLRTGMRSFFAALVFSPAVRVLKKVEHYISGRLQYLDQVFFRKQPCSVFGNLPVLEKNERWKTIIALLCSLNALYVRSTRKPTSCIRVAATSYQVYTCLRGTLKAIRYVSYAPEMRDKK